MPKSLNRRLLIGVVILFVALLCVDRFYWAQIAQWREDQSTNLWLGYTTRLHDIPVGLISSRGIPNPNGMIVLGFFLSALPNLLSVSFFLSLLQGLLVILTGWKASEGNRLYFLLATLPLLTSVILRSSSVEFWNQYIITLVNISFLFWALRYLQNRSLWNIPPIALLILLAPSLYLAGLVNAIVMTLITLGMFVYQRPILRGWVPVSIITLFIAGLSLYLTWLPYFQHISVAQLTDYNKSTLGTFDLFRITWESVFGIPSYVTFQWADHPTLTLAFKHADARILSQPAQLLLRLSGRVYLLQAVLAFATLLYVITMALLKKTEARPAEWHVNRSALRTVALSAVFIALAYAASAWLGGPAWIRGERPDQTVQFLPLFLLLIFLLPLAIMPGGEAEKIIHRLSYSSLIIFSFTNVICGFFIIRDHLQYHGNALTEADVPLIDKMQVIDFIATDWRQHSDSDIVPVDYDIDRGVWDEVSATAPAMALTQWYPAAMTEGRGFDYELLRRYGLRNQQEGTQLRDFGSGRYLVTYAFEAPPQVAAGQVTHHIFGRLRVSVVER